MKSQSEVNPLVIPEKRAAEMLGISRRTLQSLRLDGAGPPFVQITSRRVGYSLPALQEWIAARSVRSTADATIRFGGSA
ncbi:MAG: helix-turn-helix transcriptional regulator [Acetobacter sp.]|uniref:helix-turn-helix transcriptional regulator n=1 Tax=Acetobacter sp. TaxID=440 RepID=UPI003F8E45E6